MGLYYRYEICDENGNKYGIIRNKYINIEDINKYYNGGLVVPYIFIKNDILYRDTETWFTQDGYNKFKYMFDKIRENILKNNNYLEVILRCKTIDDSLIMYKDCYQIVIKK